MLFHPIEFSPLRYLDPGSGSYIFQLLIAALMGALFLLKVYWRQLRGFVARLFSRGPRKPD